MSNVRVSAASNGPGALWARDRADRGQPASTDDHDVHWELGKRKLLSECGKQLMEPIGGDVSHRARM